MRRRAFAPKAHLLTFAEYEEAAALTATYPQAGTGSQDALVYVGLGTAGEGGEVADKVKKMLRDDGGSLTSHARQALAEEVGDVRWYGARMAAELGIPLAEIAAMNTRKLADRAARGALGGSGDTR